MRALADAVAAASAILDLRLAAHIRRLGAESATPV